MSSVRGNNIPAKLAAVRDLVVAVDRYVDNQAEADDAVRLTLWRDMTTANERVADMFKVYPLPSIVLGETATA